MPRLGVAPRLQVQMHGEAWKNALTRLCIFLTTAERADCVPSVQAIALVTDKLQGAVWRSIHGNVVQTTKAHRPATQCQFAFFHEAYYLTQRACVCPPHERAFHVFLFYKLLPQCSLANDCIGTRRCPGFEHCCVRANGSFQRRSGCGTITHTACA